MNKEHRDPEIIDLEAPRLAWYKQKTWKKHQNTVYWVVKIDTLFFVPLFLVVCLVWMMSRSFRLFLITDAEIFDVLSALTEFVDLLSAQ